MGSQGRAGCWLGALSAVVLWAPSLVAEPLPGPRIQRLLEAKVAENPGDIFAWNRLSGLYLDRLRATGDLCFLRQAGEAARTSVEQADASLNLGGLAALGQVQLASHLFADARKTALEYVRRKPEKGLGWQLKGDAELELGRYEEACQSFGEMAGLEEAPTPATEARWARLDLLYGRRKKASGHLEQAYQLAQGGEEPASLPLRAWCQVQLGELAFGSGEWEKAEEHYVAALQAVPGWYAAEEHLAELRGAQGRTDEAVAAYRKLLALVNRPDLQQALGDLLVLAGRREEAGVCLSAAAAGYRASIKLGEIHFLHHATSFFTDSQPEPAQALALGRQDVEGRPSIYAWDALAWAQYANGQLPEAAASIQKALATGVQDAHILYHAGMIRMSTGDLAGGREALRACVEINPRYQTFHAHR